MLIETLSDGREVVIVKDCFVLDSVAFCKAAAGKFPNVKAEISRLIRKNLKDNDKTEAWDELVGSADTRVRLGVARNCMFLRTLADDSDASVRTLALEGISATKQYESAVYGKTELG